MNNIKDFADYYYALGMNVTCIANSRNAFNLIDQNLLKAPNHKWEHLKSIRQGNDEINSYKWETATGVGLVLGHDGLAAIDIDGCVEYSFAEFVRDKLGLKDNYSWIVSSGSGCGFHIIFKCNVKANHEEYKLSLKNGARIEDIDNWGIEDINAYYPKRLNSFNVFENKPNYEPSKLTKDILVGYRYEDLFRRFLIEDLFEKIEFRWSGHLVLPPSIHPTGNLYKFQSDIPLEAPATVEFEKLTVLKDSICSLQAEQSSYDCIRANWAKPDNISQKWGFENSPNYLIFSVSCGCSNFNDWLKLEESKKIAVLKDLAWVIVDQYDNVLKRQSYLLDCFEIFKATDYPSPITINSEFGTKLKTVLLYFLEDARSVNALVSHNINFNLNILYYLMGKIGLNYELLCKKNTYCTKNDHSFKAPELSETTSVALSLMTLYEKLFSQDLLSIDSATQATCITTKCFNKLKRLNAITKESK